MYKPAKEAYKAINPSHTFISDYWPPDCEKYICVVSAPSLWDFVRPFGWPKTDGADRFVLQPVEFEQLICSSMGQLGPEKDRDNHEHVAGP